MFAHGSKIDQRARVSFYALVPLSTVDNNMFFKSNEIFQSCFSTNCIGLIKKGASSSFVLCTAQQEVLKF